MKTQPKPQTCVWDFFRLFIEGSWLNDMQLSYLTQKSGTPLPSHSLGPRDQHATEFQCAAGITLQSYAALTFIQTAPFRHQNPSSHFPSTARSDHIAVCFQQSAYLCSDSMYEPTRVCWHRTAFPFFLSRQDCVRWNVPMNSSNSTESLSGCWVTWRKAVGIA